MLAGKVVDTIWATRKENSLVGLKFLLVKLLDGTGQVVISADTIGAGIGERVILCSGSSARKLMGLEKMPVDSVVVGIIDADCNFEQGV